MSEPAPNGGPRPGGRGLAGRVVDAVVAPFVQPVVDAVDVEDVVDRIDVDGLLERIDVDALVARIDVSALLDRIDPDALLDRVDPNRLLDRVDPNAILDRVDPNAILDRVDPNALLDRVDPNALLERVDPNALLDRVDPDRLLDRVDPDALLDRVDPNRLLDRVDPDRLLDRVDPNRLLDRVDVDAVMARVDVDAVMARVDVDAVMARVDVNGLVARTELGEIIARSTTGVFGQLVDTGRIAVMSFDLLAHGVVRRVLHRRDRAAPGGPGLDAGPGDPWTMRRTDRAVALQGRYAGVVSRFLAFLVDSTLVGALFGLLLTLVTTALQVVTNVDWHPEDSPLMIGLLYVAWQFMYFAGLTAATGRTIGKAVLGLFVVGAGGGPVLPQQAVLRTIAFPVSFLLFGFGFLLGLVRRDHRQLHDLIGGTAVVYEWDAELARLRSTAPGADEPS